MDLNYMTKKKPYHANNWKEYAAAPSDMFEPVSYEDFMDWKLTQWELSSSHVCIIRATTKKGKVKEYSYKLFGAAQKKINKLMSDNKIIELCIADDEQVAFIRREDDGSE